jgi:DNA end-binding protein Ku
VILCGIRESHFKYRYSVVRADAKDLGDLRQCRPVVAYTFRLSDPVLCHLSWPAADPATIDVQTFVPSDQIDPMLLARSYYLEPATRTAVLAYALLAAALERAERTALTQFALREKTRLGALRVRNGVMVLQTMLWPSELRAVPFRVVGRAHEPGPQELSAAQALVASMSGDFAPSDFADDYQIELKAMLDERIATGPVTKVTDADRELDREVADLVAMLRRSVEENTTTDDVDST